jgi:hypothetical protein
MGRLEQMSEGKWIIGYTVADGLSGKASRCEIAEAGESEVIRGVVHDIELRGDPNRRVTWDAKLENVSIQYIKEQVLWWRRGEK